MPILDRLRPNVWVLVLMPMFLVGISARECRANPFAALLFAECLRTATASAKIGNRERGSVVRQTSEITCGPAALATLLTYYYQEKTGEREIAELSGTMQKGTTTLLGLQKACRAKGYEATGYRMTLPQLLQEIASSRVPVLVHLKEPTLHYALVTGAVGDHILVSDPAWGEITIHEADFLRRWSSKVLAVKSSRPANEELLAHSQDSAKTRLHTLQSASSLMSSF